MFQYQFVGSPCALFFAVNAEGVANSQHWGSGEPGTRGTSRRKSDVSKLAASLLG